MQTVLPRVVPDAAIPVDDQLRGRMCQREAGLEKSSFVAIAELSDLSQNGDIFTNIVDGEPVEMCRSMTAGGRVDVERDVLETSFPEPLHIVWNVHAEVLREQRDLLSRRGL